LFLTARYCCIYCALPTSVDCCHVSQHGLLHIFLCIGIASQKVRQHLWLAITLPPEVFGPHFTGPYLLCCDCAFWYQDYAFWYQVKKSLWVRCTEFPCGVHSLPQRVRSKGVELAAGGRMASTAADIILSLYK